MKREQKTLTNKGFSLVELIIVVAIMAVLIGVLAPQYLRYVEKTRLQRDNTGMADFANVVKIACTEESVNTAIPSTGADFQFDASGVLQVSGQTALDNEINITVHINDVKLTSNSYDGIQPKITAKVDSHGIVTVSCDKWINAPGDAPTSKTF